MYIPNSFAEKDLPTLFAYMEANPLGALITSSDTQGLYATHLPLVVDRAGGPMGTLVGHFARANPHARDASIDGKEALVIFTGPEAYITPEWYATKHETGKAVPTWNYLAVHAYGVLRLREEPDFLWEHLESLTRHVESRRADAWRMSEAPADFLAQQVKAIVGVEIAITRIEGKWKMSQNRSAADIDGVIRGLSASDSPRDHEVAALVRERRPSTA
jgi:transcriptional regulator